MEEAPLSQPARQDIFRLHHEKKDYLPGLSSPEKKARLARMSYAKFLTELAGVSQEIVRLYQAAPQPLFGVGIDAVSAQDAWGLGLPGFDGMKLDPSPGKGMNRDAIRNEEAERYFFHFPDGNASIARLLVRQLIPDAIPGNSSSDIVTAKADYAKLDESSRAVRMRLNSTAVRVKHVGEPATAKEVEIAYARYGKAYTVRGKNCILACWHAVIPYICRRPRKQPSPPQPKFLCSTPTWCSETGLRSRSWASTRFMLRAAITPSSTSITPSASATTVVPACRKSPSSSTW